MDKPYKPKKLSICPFCKEKIAYMYHQGKKIAIEGSWKEGNRWEEHTCYIELPNTE